MQALQDFIGTVSGIVWGPPMLIAILGVGLLLTTRLSWLPVRKIGYGFSLLWQGREARGEGDISSFRALMTSLSATIGIGNIAGVATAIALGGPGALFWMWITALVGMATKYSEAVCAVRFRETDADGKRIGGPMHYIKNGLGENWKWLAFLFATFGTVSAVGIGCMIQSNSIADALDDHGFSPLLTSVVITALTAIVLFGGITRIATWASKLVPTMAVLYVLAGLIVVFAHATEIPAAVALVVSTAFTGTAAAGGFAGAAVWAAIRFGVARGVFSNEAGLGSAPIAHAAAQTDSPVRQGHVAMLGTFIDTLVICTITGLAIVVTGVWETGETGVDLTTMAFASVLPGSEYLLAAAVILFGYTTILGWSYYGEKCWQYLFGLNQVTVYRLLYLVTVFVGPLVLLWEGGARAGIDLIWLVADVFNALMALPNLIALALLSPIIVKLTHEYYADKKSDG